MRLPLVDLRAQYRAIADEVGVAWAGVLQRCDFVLGSEVEAFEEELAEHCEVAHAVGVDSGTSALELALRAVGVAPGDEVITAANTFVASAFAISHCGATPVLVDVDPVTYNLDVEAVERALTARTRAVIPVHLYGQPADMDPLLELAHRRSVWVVEDACQAHGARYRGRRVGGLGDVAAFSFYPGKNLGCYGDGGAVTTDDPEVAEAVRMLRNYGQRRKHRHEAVGFNRRLDTLQAAVLRVKLRRLDEWNARRRGHAETYARLLDGADVTLPVARDDVEHVWHLYVVQHDHRDALAAALARQGIATGVHYPVPIHLQPAYRALRLRRGSFPVSEWAAERILSLPMYPELTEWAIGRVAAAVGAFTPAASAITPVA